MHHETETAPNKDAAAEYERKIESLTVHLLECYEELDLIYRLSRRLGTTRDAQESADAVLGEAMEIFDADFGWIAAADPSSPVFGSRLLGAERAAVEPLLDPVVRGLIADGKSRVFDSVPRELGIKGSGLPESLLCAIVKTEGSVYGALAVGRGGASRPFTARDLKLADALSSQAAIGIENWVLQRKRLLEQQAMIRIEEEMRLAREIQTSLLPDGPPRIAGYDIACLGIPARSVGGDYYDFIPVDDGRVGLCLADVTGHGLPAALLMANLQATVRGQAMAARSPAECMRLSNRLLYRSTDAGRFASCFYGVLDIASGALTYSNAGHNHPLVVTADGATSALMTGGLILGVSEDPRYDEGTCRLDPGHVFVMYSDGITETFDRDDREFGVEGLVAAVERKRGGTAAEIQDEILRAVTAHADGRPQADDMTLVVVRRL